MLFRVKCLEKLCKSANIERGTRYEPSSEFRLPRAANETEPRNSIPLSVAASMPKLIFPDTRVLSAVHLPMNSI